MESENFLDFLKMEDSSLIIRNVMDEMPIKDRQNWWNNCLFDYEKEAIMSNPYFDKVTFEKVTGIKLTN